MGGQGPEGDERWHRTLWRAITPLGRSVAVVGLVAWLLAWRFGWQETAVLAAACLLALAIGVAMLAFGRTQLAVDLELGTPRVVVGDPATTKVSATNVASRRMLPVRLEARVGGGAANVQVPALAPEETHDELFTIPTKRRSVIPVGPVRSVQGDPLGLVRREVTWTGTEDLYVHPRSVPIPALTTGWMRDLEGETTNERSPSDVAFHTLREYVIGDDRRHIHWRTTARQSDGTLMVREFVDTRRAEVALLLSLRAADYSGDEEFEVAVSAAASVGLRAFADDQALGAMAGDRPLPTHHAPGFLDTLAGIDRSADQPELTGIAGRARDVIAGASVAVLVTGSKADDAVVRSAAQRVGRGAQTFVVRAQPGAESLLAHTAIAPEITLGELAELPRLVRGVVG